MATTSEDYIFPDRSPSNTSDLRIITNRSDKVCTYTYLKTNYIEQEFFRCRTCFDGQQDGCCSVCARNCHSGHDTISIGLTTCYCDCGLKVCSINCRSGAKCTYDYYGKTPRTQTWFKCMTCWGQDSVFGCCEECANGCHKNHKLIKQSYSPMICNCGHNGHRPNVCTYHTTGRNFKQQPFYFCATCFTDPISEGCCYQCMKNCHSGHRTRYKGVCNAYCDCGLMVCATKCKIDVPSKN